MSTWTKLPAIQGRQQPCLHAGVAETTFPPNGIIAVGFGCAMVTCDGTCMWAEGDGETDEDLDGAGAERLALTDPDHDWRIILEAPLSGRVYQRHEAGRWVLVRQSEGFA